MTSPWLPMPTLVPNAERNAGEQRQNSNITRHSSSMREAEPAVFFRDGEPEQAERAHLRQRVGGDSVVFGDFALRAGSAAR